MPTPTLKIDREHTLRLLAGQPIAIKFPKGAPAVRLLLTIDLDGKTPLDGVAKCMDVFFNGRRA